MTVRALMFGLLVVAMVVAGCGDDDDTASDAGSTTVAPAATVTEDATTTTSVQEMEVSTTTVPSAEVIEGAFTFADDDLCEWVSEDEVAEFVAAEFEWDGTAVFEGAAADRYRAAGEPEDPDSCHWTLTSTAGDVGDVLAGNASITWVDTSGDARHYREMEVDDFDEEVGYVEIGSAVSGHPSLSDGVVVYNGAWGRYVFWVPPIDQYLSMFRPFSSDGDDGDWAEDEARFFGVADRFVQELGWFG